MKFFEQLGIDEIAELIECGGQFGSRGCRGRDDSCCGGCHFGSPGTIVPAAQMACRNPESKAATK